MCPGHFVGASSPGRQTDLLVHPLSLLTASTPLSISTLHSNSRDNMRGISDVWLTLCRGSQLLTLIFLLTNTIDCIIIYIRASLFMNHTYIYLRMSLLSVHIYTRPHYCVGPLVRLGVLMSWPSPGVFCPAKSHGRTEILWGLTSIKLICLWRI